MNNEHQEQPEEESKVILYTTDDGKAQVSLMSRDGRLLSHRPVSPSQSAVTSPTPSV